MNTDKDYIMKYIATLRERRDTLVFALSNETDKPSFESINYFEVVQDKSDGRYYYTIIEDDDFDIGDLYAKFTEFVCNLAMQGKCDVNKVHPITLENIYDVDSLTSANTLEELYSRFRYTLKDEVFEKLLSVINDIEDNYVLVKKDKIDSLSKYQLNYFDDKVKITKDLHLSCTINVSPRELNYIPSGTTMSSLGKHIDEFTRYAIIEKLEEDDND